MVDVLGTVVGAKAENDKREVAQQAFQYRKQERLIDALAGGDAHVLGHAGAMSCSLGQVTAPNRMPTDRYYSDSAHVVPSQVTAGTVSDDGETYCSR